MTNTVILHARTEQNRERWMKMSQLSLGQLRGMGFQEGAWLLFCLPPFLSVVCRRGGNAPLIYNSSVLTIWYRSDDPHLAPPASSYSPSPSLWLCLLGYFSHFVSISLSPLVVFVLAHHCICSVLYVFHSLFLARSTFVCISLLNPHFHPSLLDRDDVNASAFFPTVMPPNYI